MFRLPACLCVDTMFSDTRITDSCKPPGGCWVLNLGSLEEQSVLLTTEPSLMCVCGSVHMNCNAFRDLRLLAPQELKLQMARDGCFGPLGKAEVLLTPEPQL